MAIANIFGSTFIIFLGCRFRRNVAEVVLQLQDIVCLASVGWSVVRLDSIGHDAVFLHPTGRGVARYHQIVQDTYRPFSTNRAM